MILFSAKNPWRCIALYMCLFFPLGCIADGNSATNLKEGLTRCENSAIEKSYALIHFILDDIKATYPHVGGGGISEIKQTQTNFFVVSIAQEERIDQLSYELAIDKHCKVSLVKKEESVISFAH